jgi:hypothetical protein
MSLVLACGVFSKTSMLGGLSWGWEKKLCTGLEIDDLVAVRCGALSAAARAP